MEVRNDVSRDCVSRGMIEFGLCLFKSVQMGYLALRLAAAAAAAAAVHCNPLS
jgi:hypothetical protein